MTAEKIFPPIRQEYIRAPENCETSARARDTSWAQRIFRRGAFRKFLILVSFAVLWETLARLQNNELLLPTFSAVVRALAEGLGSGELLSKSFVSLSLLVKGYLAGIVCAFVLTSLAVSTRTGQDLLSTLTSMFNPLPPIALLPLSLLWFGLGQGSLVFVLVHSVLWPLALNTHAGFQSVPETLRMTGRNYGLSGVRYIVHILIPAALPSILSGLKIGWAFAWRTLIAAELVFGASSGNGGLGWFIFQNRNELYTDKVFAGLTMVILIGLTVENLVFSSLERVTVRRWGVQH
ncbi:MAG: ABC transporter permease [Candidatus Accumulibacter sp.]|jgi:NitT/TauT family transport system permease protein|nr:ABC transporter permease [Accumulibacter sp.]